LVTHPMVPLPSSDIRCQQMPFSRHGPSPSLRWVA
jgi:hypothetical protein